jgi:hypothetical protein
VRGRLALAEQESVRVQQAEGRGEVTDDVLSFVLNGLEDYLELERELGVRSVEIDRSLLVAEKPANAPAAGAVRETGASRETRVGASPQVASTAGVPFAFIHVRPLSPRAVEMMSKIIVALGQTTETAPIAVAPPLPKARFYVFLGNRALQKYLPGVRAEENHWFKTPKGLDALFVKSPEDIVRFSTVTPALQKMKQDMWRALKTISQRLTSI